MRDDAVAAIRDAKIRRLEALEIRAAQEGYDTPPEVTNEIKDLRTQLGLLDALEYRADADIRRLFRRYDQQELNINVLAGLVQRVTGLEQSVVGDREARSRRQLIYDVLFAVLILLALYNTFVG